VLVGSSRKHMLAKLVPTNVLLAGYAMEKKSSIIAIGLTIHNTPVEIRERLAVPEAEWPRAISELCAFPHIEEVGMPVSRAPRCITPCAGDNLLRLWLSKNILRPNLILLTWAPTPDLGCKCP
jgi:hypothetical protein